MKNTKTEPTAASGHTNGTFARRYCVFLLPRIFLLPFALFTLLTLVCVRQLDGVQSRGSRLRVDVFFFTSMFFFGFFFFIRFLSFSVLELSCSILSLPFSRRFFPNAPVAAQCRRSHGTVMRKEPRGATGVQRVLHRTT